MSRIERSYRILETDVLLRSDREDWIDRFDREHEFFSARKRTDSPANTIVLELRQRTVKRFELSRNGAVVAALPVEAASLAYDLIRREIFGTLNNFFVFHGGVAAKNGRALVVAGPPESGKTTLVLGLLRKGFEFFSDEICPVHQRTMEIHPYPRAVWIADRESPKGEKKLVPAKQIGSSVGKSPASPKCLVILDVRRSGDPELLLRIVIRRDRSDEFIKDASIHNVRIEEISESEYRSLSAAFPKRRNSRLRLIEALHRHQDGILRAVYSPAAKADFSHDPTIRRILPSEAARLLLSHLIDRSPAIITGTPGSALFQVCRILRNTNCFHMVPGELTATTDLLASAWATR